MGQPATAPRIAKNGPATAEAILTDRPYLSAEIHSWVICTKTERPRLLLQPTLGEGFVKLGHIQRGIADTPPSSR
eukprot:3432223-Pyramimonas_sp.AAC.1